MNEPEDDMIGRRAAPIAWSTDVVAFLGGTASPAGREIRHAAKTMRVALAIWLSRPAANQSSELG